MVKHLIQRIFWLWINGRDYLIGHTEKPLKYGTAVMLALMATAFVADEQNIVDALDNYRHFTVLDAYFWAAAMYALSVLQIGLMRCGGLKYRAWSDVVLQLSGLLMLVAGGAFVLEYPPFFWQMAAFPFLELAVIVAGRSLGRRSRQHLKKGKRRDDR